MKKVIVTGANGFIGSSLICKLIRNQVEVVAIDISFSDLHIPENRFITRIEMGLDSVDKIISQIKEDDYDAFYHFAWQGVNGIDKANPKIQIENIEMAINCATVAKKVGCKKFLCAGTVAEQAINSLPNIDVASGGMLYGVAKFCAHSMLETYCKTIGMKFVWMQFSNIYGPLNKTGNLIGYTLQELKADRLATFGPALQPYDFIFVDDLIEAVYRIGELKNAKTQYFIGSGEPRVLKDYLYEIGRCLDKENLIKIGVRPDDRIVYSIDMFDISILKADIGDYISKTFSEGIQYTIEHFNDDTVNHNTKK